MIRVNNRKFCPGAEAVLGCALLVLPAITGMSVEKSIAEPDDFHFAGVRDNSGAADAGVFDKTLERITVREVLQ